MEIEGLIINDLGVSEGVSKAGNPWKKHEWLLETPGQYPRRIKFDVFGEKCNTLTFECNKSYVVQVDVESREFNGRWYTDLRAYNARLSDAQVGGTMGNGMGNGMGGNNLNQQTTPGNPFQQAPQAQPAGNPFQQPATPDFTAGDAQEDLPF